MLQYLQTNTTTFLILVFVFSLLFGSLLNVIIYRLPIMLKLSWRQQCLEFLEIDDKAADSNQVFNLFLPRSHCPQCKKMVKSWENIPLLSYLFLRGKCSNCGSHISLRYPFVELLSAVIATFLAWHYGVTWIFLASALFSWMMIVLVFIDLDHQLLPDDITLPLLWVGLLLSLFNIYVDSFDAIVGAASGYLFLWLVAFGFKSITKKEGMGYGDLKLLATFGAWFGWQVLPFILLASSLIGTVMGIAMIFFGANKRETPIPFGPYLAIAGWVAMLWGHSIIQYYLTFL